MHAKSLQSCLTLCDPMDWSLPGSSVHEILQARILEGAAMPPSRGSSQPRDRTCISFGSCTAGGFFTAEPWGKACLATEFCASVSHLILDCLIRSPSLNTLCLICLLSDPFPPHDFALAAPYCFCGTSFFFWFQTECHILREAFRDLRKCFQFLFVTEPFLLLCTIYHRL